MAASAEQQLRNLGGQGRGGGRGKAAAEEERQHEGPKALTSIPCVVGIGPARSLPLPPPGPLLPLSLAQLALGLIEKRQSLASKGLARI